LPPGETETGTWATQTQTEVGLVFVPISFPIPLETALTGGNGEENDFIFLEPGEGQTEECPGTANDPQATPGWACVYTAIASEASPLDFIFGVSATSGATMVYSIEEAGGNAAGTFAVTAPCPNQVTLAGELKSLKSQLDNAEGQLSTLEAELATMEEPGSGATEEQINDKKQEIATKKGEVETLEDEVSAKQAELTAAKAAC
jgi:hypothetical protein